MTSVLSCANCLILILCIRPLKSMVLALRNLKISEGVGDLRYC